MDFSFVREEDKEYIDRQIENVNSIINSFDVKDLDLYVIRRSGKIYKYSHGELNRVDTNDCKHSHHLYEMGYMLRYNTDCIANDDEGLNNVIKRTMILKSYMPIKTAFIYENTGDIYYINKLMTKDEAVPTAFYNYVGIDRSDKRALMRKVKLQPKDYKCEHFTNHDLYTLLGKLTDKIFKSIYTDADKYVNKSLFSNKFSVESILEYKLIKAILYNKYMDNRYYYGFKDSYLKKYGDTD
ncbi:MAG: hypothetical protein ACRC92_26505 [Peptostreptococcaceae bacterium]